MANVIHVQQDETIELTHSTNEKFSKIDERHALITLNIISIFVSSVCGTITFFLAVEDQSAAALGFATDTILDVLAFATVIWRFTTNRKSSRREVFASRFLASLLFLSATAVFLFSIYDLVHERRPVENEYLIVAVSMQTMIFSCLAIGKYIVAKRLHMISAYSDAFNTSIAAAMAFSVAISIAIYDANQNVWYLDTIIGLSFSFITVIYGFWMLFKSCF